MGFSCFFFLKQNSQIINFFSTSWQCRQRIFQKTNGNACPFLRRNAEDWIWEPVFCMRWSLLTNQRTPLRHALPNGPRQESEKLVCVWLRARLPPSTITGGYCRSKPEKHHCRTGLFTGLGREVWILHTSIRWNPKVPPKIDNCLFDVCEYKLLILLNPNTTLYRIK